MKNKLLTCLTLFLLLVSCCLVGCGSQNPPAPFLEVSLESSLTATKALQINVSNEPAKISFSEKQPALKNVFGSQTYDVYNITLSGIAMLDNIKTFAIPTNENGETLSPNQTDEIAYFTDYFALKFKTTSNIKTISVGAPNNSEAINKNRLNGEYYILNFKWLKLTADKETATTFDYDNDNYFLIETKDANNKTLLKFMIHLTYDLTFI